MPDATDLRAVRRRCAALLRTLPVPVPFDLPAFCAALAAQRHRPLLLEPFPIGAAERRALLPAPDTSSAVSTGAWYASATTDYILYEQETSPLHQEHIILHELGHVLCGHPPRAESAAALHAAVLAHVRLDLVEGALRQGSYSTAEECEAEVFASLILEQPTTRGVAPSTRPGDGPGGMLHHLGAVLEAGGRPSV